MTERPPNDGWASVLAGRTVLVVDDEDDPRELVAYVIQKSGAHVLEARSVDEAMAIVEQQHVDLIVSDIGMPGADGYALVRKLRASARPELRSLPAAALTAFVRAEDRQRALAEGFQLHMAKPIDPGSLLRNLIVLVKPR